MELEWINNDFKSHAWELMTLNSQLISLLLILLRIKIHLKLNMEVNSATYYRHDELTSKISDHRGENES